MLLYQGPVGIDLSDVSRNYYRFRFFLVSIINDVFYVSK